MACPSAEELAEVAFMFVFTRAVVLRLESVSESPGAFIKDRLLAPPPGCQVLCVKGRVQEFALSLAATF